MFRVISFSIALVSFAWMGAPAHAASFDCAEAKTPDEITICNSPGLSELDTEMGALWFTYEKIPFLMGGSAARKEEAEAFLKRRSECGRDEACLRKVYEERIRTLKQGIHDWMKSDSAATQGVPQTWSAAALPDPVQNVAQKYEGMCTQIDGKLEAGSDQPLVMTADMDGDALQDFVLNPQNMQCSAAATTFCPSGGCYMYLALSSANYENPAEILGGSPSFTQNEADGTILEVWVDQTNCDQSGGETDCLARYAWKDGKISTTYKAEKYQD